MGLAAPLIDELEALDSRDPGRRSAILQRVTDLFIASSDTLNEEQIAVFDDVLMHLVERIELKALIRLGAVLAPIHNAPAQVIRRLAFDDNIAVAGPVLAQSQRLSEADLIDIAMSKGNAHLLAIAARSQLSAPVGDILVERGNIEVKQQLARNTNAKFSEATLKALLNEDILADALRERLDLPLHLQRELLARAAHMVHGRLAAAASPDARSQIEETVVGIAHEVSWEAMSPRDFSTARHKVQAMKDAGQLSQAALERFARERQYEEMTAALALMSDCPINVVERLMKNVQPDSLLVVCKAAALDWSTTKALLSNRFGHHAMSSSELARSRDSFAKIPETVARAALDYWKTRSLNLADGADAAGRPSIDTE